jgi:hypothetical protein
MAERARDALVELRERSPCSRDDDLVFCHPESGHPLDRSKLVRRFKQALERAEVRRGGPGVRVSERAMLGTHLIFAYRESIFA